MRLRTAVAFVGILTGAWALAGSYIGNIGRAASCSVVSTSTPCATPGPNIFVVGLAVLLILNSVVSLFGPSIVFYASAGLAIFLGLAMVPGSSVTDPVALTAMALAVATFVLSLVAARRRTQVSEQANPMNLPVFG